MAAVGSRSDSAADLILACEGGTVFSGAERSAPQKTIEGIRTYAKFAQQADMFLVGERSEPEKTP